MASTKRDDLAKRLAERIDKAPDRGRAMQAGSAAPAVPPQQKRTEREERAAAGPAQRGRATGKRTTSKRAAAKRAAPSSGGETRAVVRPRRGESGTVLRGHLVPDAIHSEARRRKAELRSDSGHRVTWDDVMCEGVALLVARGRRVEATLEGVRGTDPATVRRRLVQATLPVDLNRALVDLQLDLGDRSATPTTYEQLWTSAVQLWLEATA